MCIRDSPHTGEETTLLKRHPGHVVNLENDIVGKYIQRLMQQKMPEVPEEETGGLTMEFLKEYL
jgi:riboflavin synthase